MNTLYSFPLDFEKQVNQTNYYWFEEGFTSEELSQIEQQVQEIPSQAGVTESGGQDQGEGLESRNSMIKWVPFSEETKWIYDKIGELANIANEEMFNFVIQYDLKIFYINPPTHIILERSKERNNAWDNITTWKKRLSEKKKYDKIVNNEKYKKYIEVRENLNMEQSKNISNEIIKIMNPKLTGGLPI